MSVGRVLGATVASLAVAGCAVVAVGMSRAASDGVGDKAPEGQSSLVARSTAVPHPALLPARPVSTTSTAATPSATYAASSTVATTSAATPPRSSVRPAATTLSARVTSSAPTTHTTSATPRPSTRSPRPAVSSPAVQRGQALPLRYSTGSAVRVITVTAHTSGSTTATLQAWSKAPGGGWLRHGSAITAHVGADGLSTHASESRSATPIGSFTLTLAFGHDSNPGTRLPYIHTNPADWWISQPGPLYNTHQHCSSGCPFTRGSPNEHLYYETPYYNYAVVIDYNTRNAPGGVRQGAGSAFFLHVTDGNPTAGCVAIAQSQLVPLLRWLAPSTHPRILIGVH